MRRHSPNRYLAIAVIAVLVYSVILYSGTAYLQERIAIELTKSTRAEKVAVELRPNLPFGLITGSFTTVQIVMHGALLGPITAQQVTLVGEQIDISISSLIAGEPLAFDKLGTVDARLDLTEDNLNAYFERFSIASQILQVTIEPDSFQLGGVIPIVGRRLEVSLQGNLTVLPENRLRIIPTRLVVQNAEMPPILMEELLKDYLIIPLDLASLPVPLQLSEVLLGEGEVSVIANTR